MAKTFAFRPLGEKIVVKPSQKDGDKKLASGIIIPETANKERPARGKVVAVGEGKREEGKLVPLTVQVGDEVLFSKYGYDEIKLDDVEYYILSESSVLGIITN